MFIVRGSLINTTRKGGLHKNSLPTSGTCQSPSYMGLLDDPCKYFFYFRAKFLGINISLVKLIDKFYKIHLALRKTETKYLNNASLGLAPKKYFFETESRHSTKKQLNLFVTTLKLYCMFHPLYSI